MGKIIHFVGQSLDGFMEGPNGEFDWPVMDPELSEYSRVLGDQADRFLYGRVVWDMMSSFWPKAEELSDHPHDLEFAPIWRAKPKVVVSRTLNDADWNTRVTSDLDELAELRESETLVLFGGSVLATSLAERGLIDEYQVSTHPVILGGGRPAIEAKQRVKLRLVEARTFDSQVVLSRHEVVG